MYTISNEYKNILENKLSLSPKTKIVVAGVEYTGSVIKTYPKICHKNSTMIGGFPAKTCSFEIYDINNNLDFENKEITVYRGLDVNGVTEWIPQGIFIPTSDKIKTNISTKTTTFSDIQDKSQFFDSKYESNLDWLSVTTHTGLEIVQEICTKLGIILETSTFNWYNYNFKQPNFPSNITYREVISRIAEISGSIAYISRNGGLVIKGQDLTGHSIARKRYKKLSKEKQFGPINVVVLGKDGVDDDIVYPSALPSNVVEWKILDNPFVDLYREEMIETVASYIIGQSIIPFELTDFVDGFYLDLNDIIQVTDKNGNTFNATLLNYESTSRIKATISAETQNKSITNYQLAGSSKSNINNVKLQVDHINNNITALTSTVTENSEKIVSLELIQEQLTAKVNSVVDVTREISGNNNIVLEDATEGNILVLKISGNISKLLPPFYPGQETYLKNMNLVIENESGEKNRIELPFNRLLSYNNVSDEFVIDETGTYIIHRIGQKDDLSFYILSNEQKETLQSITIPLNEGYNKIYLESFENVHFYAKYAFQNELVSTFATKVEMNSALELQNENINIELSKKVDDDEIIAKINLSTEKAEDGSLLSIQADKIKLEGLVTANENFKINLDGSIETKNMYLPNGGRVIGGDGLFSNLQFISEESIVGYTYNAVTEQYEKSKAIIYCYIPQNFTIDSAKITIIHTQVKWTDVGSSGSSVLGACKNVGLFYSNGLNRHLQGAAIGYFNRYDSTYFSEINNAFGENRFTADTPTETSRNSQIVESVDVKSSLSAGQNILSIETANATPSNMQTAYEENGDVIAIMNIIGYIKSENNEEGSDN